MCRDETVPMPGPEHLTQDIGDAAKALTNALRAGQPELSHSRVLNALASSWGEKNWQVLKAKVSRTEAVNQAWPSVQKAAWEVVLQADNSGCSEDLTVTSQQAIEQLEAALLKVQSGLAQAT